MTAEEMKQYKAKQLRYKKPIARYMNLDFIREAVGAGLRVYQSFVALKYRFDFLDASLKIIQETNLEGLEHVNGLYFIPEVSGRIMEEVRCGSLK